MRTLNFYYGSPVFYGALILLTACGAPQGTKTPTLNVATQLPPPEKIKECTSEGCDISFTVIFEGAVPDDYVMVAEALNVDPMEVHCIGGEGQYSDDHFLSEQYPMCLPEGVGFVNYSPQEVTITVDTNGSSSKQVFVPEYQIVFPNGADCEPECREGSVTFSVLPPLSFEPLTYRDEAAGFEFNYPASWTADEPQIAGDRGYFAQFTSYPHEPGVIPDIQPPGSSQLQATVLLWDPKHNLDGFIDVRRQGWSVSGTEILSEEENILSGDWRAVSFVIQSFDVRSYFLITTLGERYLVLSGQGDMNLLNEIALTLRPLK